MSVEVRGARDFYAVSKSLKAAGNGQVRKEFHKAVRDAAKPLLPKVREAARRQGPKHGGLNEHLAKKPLRVQTRTGNQTAGVRIVETKVDARIDSLGRIQHPVPRSAKKVVQYVPEVKGYFSETLRQAGPTVARDVVKTMDDFTRRIIRGQV